MSKRFLPTGEPVPAGETLQYVVGEIYRLLQEQFGKRDAEIFRRFDAGEGVPHLAKSFGLSKARIRQIIDSVERFVNDCFCARRLRILPMIQKLKSEEDQIELILSGAGYAIDKSHLASLKKVAELAPDPQPFTTELDKLNLNARSRNVLIHNNITTIEALCNLSYNNLHFMRGMGPDSISQIKAALKKEGLHIKE